MIIFLLCVPLNADLPVHCTQPDVLGTWTFHIGMYLSNGAMDSNCGYTAPDSYLNHRHLTPPVRDPSKKEMGEYWLTDNFKDMGSIRVELSSTATKVTHASKSLAHLFQPEKLPVGNWTMVYDEGMQLSMSGERSDVTHSFFAFNKYVLDESESNDGDFLHNTANSDCSTTLLGWYKTFRADSYDVIENRCWWGERVSDLAGAPVFPRIRHRPGYSKYWPLLLLTALLLTWCTWRYPWGRRPNPNPNPNPDPNRNTWHWYSLPWYGATSFPRRRKPPGSMCRIVAWSAVAVCSLCFVGWRVHTASPRVGEVTNRYRSLPTRWTAQSSHAFASFLKEKSANMEIPLTEHSTMQALVDRMLPRKRILPGFATEENIGPVSETRRELKGLAHTLGVPVDSLTPEVMKEAWGDRVADHFLTKDVVFLDANMNVIAHDWRTKAFNWREIRIKVNGTVFGPGFVPASVDQGNCGSCFAVAATTMYTARILIRYPELIHKLKGDRISWNYPLECSIYNQGCSGGYPFIVSKWASENDLVTDSCFSSGGVGRDGNNVCTIDSSNPKCQDRFRVRNFRYVGGAVGRCSYVGLCEQMIREELFKGGPLSVAMSPQNGFFSYKSGVLHETDVGHKSYENRAAMHKDCNTHACFTWAKEEHSVALVGWGEEEKPSCWGHNDSGKCDHADEFHCKNIRDCHWSRFPYWIAQNSWGSSWGDEGFFNIGPRGFDPMHIESLAVAADVEMVSRSETKSGARKKDVRSILTTFRH